MLSMAIVAPLGPYAGPHTSWDPVMASHVFVGPDGGLAGLVGSVVGFGFRGLVSSFVGAGVWAFLARPGLVPVPLGLLGGGEEEGAGHLVEGGAARVFHPNGTILPPVDTTDGAPLYPGGVGLLDDRPTIGFSGRSSFFSAPLGCRSWSGGGGGGGRWWSRGGGGGWGRRQPP